MKKLMFILISALLILSAAACSSSNSQGDDLENESRTVTKDVHKQGVNIDSINDSVFNTKNVTRLETDNLIQAAVLVSKTVWPATHDENRPGTVILAPAHNWQIALASADLIHHPNNGPILFYENGKIPKDTLDELVRLAPLGNSAGTEVMVVGNADPKIMHKLKDYKVEEIKGEEPSAFAEKVDQKYAEVSGELPQSVIIVSADEQAKLYSLIAANWIAHMPEPILYVTKEGIPEATKRALQLRNKKANIYILGPQSVIPSTIQTELKKYGAVTRIEGKDPIEASIAFAKFKDEKTKFGWGLTEPGHGLVFISTDNADFAIAGAPFAHLGKHAPLIWLNKGKLSNETHDFLALLQPKFTDDPTVGPYNHAFIIGGGSDVTMKTQGMIDQMLEIIPAHGGGHGGH